MFRDLQNKVNTIFLYNKWLSAVIFVRANIKLTFALIIKSLK
ncbi:hypothetical protein BC670_1522 [Flavobacterium branchiophilum]|uniref:Uncharacterized protein n=1 Tax=Flavobacterium branchiophilum TaxID=55197 RepID=A0A543G3F2_9FLAO|nr:hypothetical protein BC670_1522 [Flavobacterium branchiophilum]